MTNDSRVGNFAGHGYGSWSGKTDWTWGAYRVGLPAVQMSYDAAVGFAIVVDDDNIDNATREPTSMEYLLLDFFWVH
jgi:hypothetical protein